MKTKKNPLKKLIIKDSFWTLMATLISRAGGMIFTIILARFLLPAGFGTYGLALTIALIFVTFSDLGINQTMIRFVSTEIRNKKKASAYFRYLLKIKMLVSIIVSFALLLLAYPLSIFLFSKPELFTLLIILSFYIFLTAIGGFFESLFYVKSKVNLLAFKEIVFQTFRISLVLLVFYFLSSENYLIGTVSGLLIASLIAFILIFFLFKKSLKFDIYGIDKISNKKRVLRFIWLLTLASSSAVLFSYLDTIMLGIYLSPEFIGYYRASMSIIIAIAGLLSFPGVFLSALTKVRNKNIQKPFNTILRALMILIIPSIVGVVIMSKYLIVFLFGYEYLPSQILLAVLSPIIFLFVVTSLFLNVLSAKDSTKEFAFLTLFATLANVILNLLFIKFFLQFSELSATKGVAVATLISWSIYFIGGIIILKDKINVEFKFSYIIKPLLASLVMGTALVLFNFYFPEMSLLKGILEVIAGIAIYLVVSMLLKSINKSDFKGIYSLVK